MQLCRTITGQLLPFTLGPCPSVLGTLLPLLQVVLIFFLPSTSNSQILSLRHIVSLNSGLIFKKKKNYHASFYSVFLTPNILEHLIHSLLYRLSSLKKWMLPNPPSDKTLQQLCIFLVIKYVTLGADLRAWLTSPDSLTTCSSCASKLKVLWASLKTICYLMGLCAYWSICFSKPLMPTAP